MTIQVNQNELLLHKLYFIVMDAILKRITINPDICHGKPTIRSMHYPVEMILDLLSSGMTTQEISNDYPAIETNNVKACLAYASRLTRVKSIHKVVA
jgi:uncharacterized protein (DUF433 family)